MEEAEYYVLKSKQVVLLSSAAATDLASTVVNSIQQKHGSRIENITVMPHIQKRPICSALDMVISSDPPMDDRSAGVVIFTSGTTGKPKGAVLRRSYTHYTAEAIGEGYDIDNKDTLLHVLPVHHTTGLGTSFFPWIIAGACIEFRSGSFDPKWIWDRWVRDGITVFSGVPTIYMRLKWYFEQNIALLPAEQKDRYVAAANQLRVLKCGSSALQKDVQIFWTQLRNGRPILTRYGATEFPGCIKVPSGMDPTTLPADCVGMVVPGVEVKLSDGESGELLVKSPYMFSRSITQLYVLDFLRSNHI
jgi:malonyl-CoA/methylmalonyl-CoA synthetase